MPGWLGGDGLVERTLLLLELRYVLTDRDEHIAMS
jgi:hypothetical protein